jgi:hypothetical protein
MKFKYIYFLLIGGVIFSGCASVSSTPRPTSYYAQSVVEQGISQQSLFSSDNTVLSDEDISRILSYRYSPQQKNRIGILNIGRSSWLGWSADLDKSSVEIQSKLISKLRSSPIVYDASYLPSLLIPEKKTVAFFREAGARYQADLLILYQISFQTYEKYKILSPDKIKSYCTVEAVLLDTRTGIVPFTSTASREFTTEKSEQDLSLNEARRRAEIVALGDALTEIGDNVVIFLNSTIQQGH